MSKTSLQQTHRTGDAPSRREHPFLAVDHCEKIFRQEGQLKLKRIYDSNTRYMMYLHKGAGSYTSPAGKSTMMEGSLFVGNRNAFARGSFAIDKPSLLYVAYISGYGLEEQLRRIRLDQAQIISVGDKEKVAGLYDSILLEHKNRKLYWADNVTAHMLELFADIGHSISAQKGMGDSAIQNDIHFVLRLMSLEYNQWHDVGYYAGKANLSVYRFIHKFKEATGMTPIEHITHLRVQNAKSLMETTSLKICEVANIVGYENPLYFSRVFKKVTGFSPSKYCLGLSFYPS